MMQDATEPSRDAAGAAGPRITHAQPLAPGQEAGTFVAQPLLSPVEAELEAHLGIEECYAEFGALDELALGLHTPSDGHVGTRPPLSALPREAGSLEDPRIPSERVTMTARSGRSVTQQRVTAR